MRTFGEVEFGAGPDNVWKRGIQNVGREFIKLKKKEKEIKLNWLRLGMPCLLPYSTSLLANLKTVEHSEHNTTLARSINKTIEMLTKRNLQRICK